MSPQPDFAVEPGLATSAFDAAVSRLERAQFVSGLWSRRLELWTKDGAVQATIAHRLGWLDAIRFVTPQLTRIEEFAEKVRTSGLSDVVLLGMGGSSLAPEVLRCVLGRSDTALRFRMLDSTDPSAVREALEHAATSLFVLASKSGTTIEPNAMAAEAKRRVESAGVVDWGSRFIAITDRDTALHQRALNHGFLDVFVNPSDIGGRYSALSFFGMVPAALMGIVLPPIVDRARAMAEACRSTDVRANPGVALGALMGAAAQAGRDKLTLMVPAQLESFGLWVEQLVAESTGKQKVGVVPIVGDPIVPDAEDRFAVVMSVAGDGPDERTVDQVRAGGVPIVTIDMPDVMALGAEFFRWEVATAAASWLLDVNPFDEPNVKEAKRATGELLDAYAAQGALPREQPGATHHGIQLTLNPTAAQRLGTRMVSDYLSLLEPRSYFAILAYAPPGVRQIDAAFRALRSKVARTKHCATTLGYGPRYLHSTGQLHKGGANNGVFLIITADASEDLGIPEATYSFGVLELSQALGDFRSLDRAGRPVLHAHLPALSTRTLEALADFLVHV